MAGEVTRMKDELWVRRGGNLQGIQEWKEWLVAGGAGVILGQAMIYREAAPFVMVFSLIVWQKRRKWYAPFMLGGIVGTVFGAGWPFAIVELGWSLTVPLPWSRPGWQFLKWPLLAIGSAAICATEQPLTPYSLTIVGGIAVGSVVLFYLLERELNRIRAGMVDRGTLVLGLTTLGCLVAGLAGYQLFHVSPSLWLGAVIMLAAAILEGPSGGAVAGATLGLTLALRGNGYDLVGILVAGGFLSGWGATKHWRLSSLGLVFGVLIYAIFIATPSALEQFWVSMALAALLFQVLPDHWVAMGRDAIETFTGPNAKEELSHRMNRIAGVMKEMARAFRVEDDLATPETHVVQHVVDTVCKKCSLYRSCWEDEFYRSYRGLVDLSAKAEQGVVVADDLVGDLRRRCIRPDTLAQAANVAMNRERERASFALRIKESRALAESQLQGLAQLVIEMAQDVHDDGPKRLGWKANVLTYEVAVAKRPRQGGVVSGDSELIRELSPERVVFGISDGMGVGPRAAWESGTAMSLLEQLLMAGFSQTLAVKAVNTTLLLRSVDDHFATLDLLLLDRTSRKMEIVKVAASPTYIKRGENVFTIESHSLPVGIVQEVRIEPTFYTVESGDVLVMVTDGVFDSDQRRGEERLRAFLSQLPRDTPRLMAETILSFMLGDSGDGRDDALVMVVTLGSTASVRRQDKGSDSRVKEWQRITPISLDARTRIHRG